MQAWMESGTGARRHLLVGWNREVDGIRRGRVIEAGLFHQRHEALAFAVAASATPLNRCV